MRLLLDTHIAIWALAETKRLSIKAREAIEDNANDICVSAISIVEIAIKRTLGKRQGVPPFSSTEAMRLCLDAGYRLVDLTPAHSEALERLPPLHDDPFDRLLIAQAFAEPFRLVTHDAKVAAYGGNILFV